MVVIKKRKNRAYILLESLVSLAILALVSSSLLSAIRFSRDGQARELQQQEALNVAKMMMQTRQTDTVMNGVRVRVDRRPNSVSVFYDGKELIHIVKN